MLLVPAVVAGEPAPWLERPADDVALAGHAGGGLFGLEDPRTLGVDGSKPENETIGPKILELAGKPEKLALTNGPFAFPRGPHGIPGNMLTAYMRAAQHLAASAPNCNLKWSLLASIGRIESGHARGGQTDAKGTTLRRILGPELNGAGPVAAIRDTDGGRWDGNPVWDHAVGPMQFIPSTWKGYASDGNGDGQTDPNNIHDAAVGAGKYLCSGGMNLSDPRQLATAIFRYNNSDSYVRTVILWADTYGRGVRPMAPTPVRDIPRPIIPPSRGDGGDLPPGITPTQPPSTPPKTTTPRPPGSTSPKPTTTTGPTTTTTTGPTTTGPTTTTTGPTTTTTTTGPTTTTTTTPPSCEPTPTTTTTAEPTTTTTTTPVEDPCGTDSGGETPTTSPTTTPPSISVTPTAT